MNTKKKSVENRTKAGGKPEYAIDKNLRYGCATLPWCEKRQGWVKPSGMVIVTRREAGDYVERLHLLIKSMKDRKSIVK